MHPTHSLWACGKDAAEFVADEINADSPATTGFCWDKLADRNAKILLIGVKNNKNTFIHSVDERAKLPDRISRKGFEVTITDHNGEKHQKLMRYHDCSKTNDISIYYGNFEKPMVETGVQTFGRFGDAQVRVIDAMACRELIMKIYSRAESDIFAQDIELPEALYKSCPAI